MNGPFSGPWGVVSTVIAIVAIAALIAVLILLGKQRAQVRRANELLELSRELRHRYDALQAVTKEGVLVQSLSGRVLDISERAAAILGIDAASAVGRSVADLPVVLGYVDSATRTAGLGPTLRLSGDVTADMDRIRAFYADKAGLRPERRTTPRLREEQASEDS